VAADWSWIDSTTRCGGCSLPRGIRPATPGPRAATAVNTPRSWKASASARSWPRTPPESRPGSPEVVRYPQPSGVDQDRRHHGPESGSAGGASTRLVPHFMQKRRVELFGVLQFGQMTGGITSPSGILWPHFMQNFRSTLLGVPQFVQKRLSSAGGGGLWAPGTTSSSSSDVPGVSVAVAPTMAGVAMSVGSGVPSAVGVGSDDAAPG